MAKADAEAAAPAPAGGQTGTWKDPYRSYNFKVMVQGVGNGHFTECSGLAMKVQSIAYREAGGGPVIHRLPGQIEHGEVTLRYGLTTSMDLWQWFLSAVQGKVDHHAR
jgi:phage tail-like protein